MDDNGSIIFLILDYHGQLSSVLGGLALVILIIFSIFIIKNKYNKILLSLSILFILMGLIKSDIKSINKYFNLRKIYMAKQYKEITGNIKEHKVFTTQGTCSHEIFKVHDVEFQYDSCRVTGGFNKPKVVKDGMQVKIRYINKDRVDKYGNGYKKIILYLEKL